MPIFETKTYKTYYELHGEGTPMLVMGGWGTFCHGQHTPIPRTLMKTHRVLLFDYPGIAESTDDPAIPATTSYYSSRVKELLDHLKLAPIHIYGLVGLGGCIGQDLAITRPDLVRSLAMGATWAKCDHVLHDQIEGLRMAFERGGFEHFQLIAACLSFAPEFYNAHRDEIIGPNGAWSDLRGRAATISRIVDACLTHDVTADLHRIRCPTFVTHGGRDLFCGPRFSHVLTDNIPNAIGYDWPELAHIPSGGEEKKRLDRILGEFFASVEKKGNAQ